MAIKITKKRNVEAPRPDPVVTPPTAPAQSSPVKRREPVACTLCGNFYLEPCNGENANCMPGVWYREKHGIK